MTGKRQHEPWQLAGNSYPLSHGICIGNDHISYQHIIQYSAQSTLYAMHCTHIRIFILTHLDMYFEQLSTCVLYDRNNTNIIGLENPIIIIFNIDDNTRIIVFYA